LKIAKVALRGKKHLPEKIGRGGTHHKGNSTINRTAESGE
jgi:hypothetical protein